MGVEKPVVWLVLDVGVIHASFYISQNHTFTRKSPSQPYIYQFSGTTKYLRLPHPLHNLKLFPVQNPHYFIATHTINQALNMSINSPIPCEFLHTPLYEYLLDMSLIGVELLFATKK